MKENLARSIVISYDPKIIGNDENFKYRFETILFRNGVVEVRTIDEIEGQGWGDYHSRLRAFLENCDVLFLILPQSPNRYKRHFEMVFDCAFFREIPIFLYIPPKMLNSKKVKRKNVKRRIKVQKAETRGNICPYEDLDELARLINEHIFGIFDGLQGALNIGGLPQRYFKLNKQRDTLIQKRDNLEMQKLSETRIEEKERIEYQVSIINTEIKQVEQELSDLEAQL